MSGGNGAMALVRALAASGPAFTLVEVESRDWSSATFTGERHRVHVGMTDDAATTAWLAALPELELTVRGRLVADLAVTEATRDSGRTLATVEALTICSD